MHSFVDNFQWDTPVDIILGPPTTRISFSKPVTPYMGSSDLERASHRLEINDLLVSHLCIMLPCGRGTILLLRVGLDPTIYLGQVLLADCARALFISRLGLLIPGLHSIEQ